MSFVGKLMRRTGMYDRLKEHFVESLLLPFATQGQISVEEAGFLGELVRGTPSEKEIVEIGTLFGRSTRVIAENKNTDQKLITVDRFSWNPIGLSDVQHRRVTEAILRDAIHESNVHLVPVDKAEFFRSYGGCPALVFLDADHSYASTRKDIEWALSVDAGVICGHDYVESMPGVVRAVDENGGVARRVGSLWVLGRGNA